MVSKPMPHWLPLALALGALLLAATGWATYLARIPRGEVPPKPIGTLAVEGVGALGGGAAIALAGGAAAVVVPGSIAAILGVFFVWLYRQRSVPEGEIQVEVGGRLRPFTVSDHTGAPFSSDELAGHRVLLKFFRGSW